MKKMDSYEKMALVHIKTFWVLQDQFFNIQSIELYENLYKKCKNNKQIKKILMEGLELLYAERKQIKHRKADLRSKASVRVLRWSGTGTTKQV